MDLCVTKLIDAKSAIFEHLGWPPSRALEEWGIHRSPLVLVT